MALASLPILPLRRVVLPGTSHLVRAFDEAARRMVAEMDGGVFGAVLVREPIGGEAGYHGIGTQMEVVDRIDQPDDRVTLQALGRRRFAVRTPQDGPYPRALVEFLADDAVAAPLPALGAAVRPLLRRYLAVLAESGHGADVMMEVAPDPVTLSYQVASVMRLSAPERQELLELSADRRLARERSLLAREIDLLERTMGVERG